MRPFEFVRELFNKRLEIKWEIKKTGKYNIEELAIKICLNSMYGKMAQRIGGTNGQPPATSCPYYAAAITANCRRRVLEASLEAPDEIIGFMTDAVVSSRELKKLTASDLLGEWEGKEHKDGLFLQSGVYSYLTEKIKDGIIERDVTNKSRGLNWTPSIFFKMSKMGLPRPLPFWVGAFAFDVFLVASVIAFDGEF